MNPDGERWVDKNWNIKWDTSGPTNYANNKDIKLGETLLSTRTGKKQMEKLINQSIDIIVDIDDMSHDVKRFGATAYQGHSYVNGKYRPNSKITITIFKRKAENRIKTESLLTIDEAMAVNFGHEIEHTTDEAIYLNATQVTKEKKEQMTINQDYLVTKDVLTHKTINNNNDLASVGLYYYEYVFSAFPHKYVFLKHSDSCTVLTDIVESGERYSVSMPLKQLLGLAEKIPILSKSEDTSVVDYVKIICDIYLENTEIQ